MASYEDRILRVLDFMHDNPAGDLSLDALADVAAMSRFHWHRVFFGMTGESCHAAARRIRLHRAACWLVQTDDPIAKVAARAGYDNQQSFTRIFGEAYGLTPGAFRNRGELRPPLLRPEKGTRPVFDISVETRPNLRLLALPHSGPYLEVGRAFEKISAIFTSRALWPHARGMAGLYYDDPNAVAAADLRSHAGVVVTEEAPVPDPAEDIAVAGGRFAVLHYKGPYAGLKAAYDHLYGDWLPASGEEPADAPVMEVYLNSPNDTSPDDLLTDICLPLSAKA